MSPLELSVSALLLTSVLQAQFNCPAVVPDSWVRETPTHSAVLEPVPVGDISYVLNREAEALRRLGDQSVIALTAEEAEAFLGATGTRADGDQKPYLVRLVAATPTAQLTGAGWSGDNLVMTTLGLGCRSDTRRAVVVYADRPPAQLMMRLRAELR
ncbi:hypothetical protein [Brevundimonas sp. GCM10030266]|uniref:hypothetical protein n=1 Tax=Brevundimonas sp. GCM10030266 TaxID=3273386 RepID=UPI0036093A57